MIWVDVRFNGNAFVPSVDMCPVHSGLHRLWYGLSMPTIWMFGIGLFTG